MKREVNQDSDVSVYTTSPASLKTEEFFDYELIIVNQGITYCFTKPYIVVGKHTLKEGWLIHVSIVRQQFMLAAPQIISELLNAQVSFLMPSGSLLHNEILDGRRGLDLVGKVISVISMDVNQVKHLTKTLIGLTNDLKGPEVLDAAGISACVYLSYGTLIPGESKLRIRRGIPVSGTNILIDHLKARKIDWPFNDLLPLKKEKTTRLIARRYLPLQQIKNDPKGSVWKCIKLNLIYNSELCLLKQGNPHQCFDDSGRDIRDRLNWQFEAQKKLIRAVPLPQIKEIFEYDHRTYLSMEFLEGTSLSDIVTSIFSGKNWINQEARQQFELLSLTTKVIDIIANLHRQEFLHRDLNPDNFIVLPNGKVYLTDLELCYSIALQLPSPPFLLGTPGYISPQQQNSLPPQYSDDIYSLGGILIKIFTGLPPLKFSTQNTWYLAEQLKHFFPNKAICRLIEACLHPDPTERPTLYFINKTIESFQSDVSSAGSSPLPSIDQYISTQTIKEAVKALATPLFIDDKLHWLSESFGLAEGRWGMMYALAKYARTDLFDSEDESMVRHHLREMLQLENLKKNEVQGNFFPGKIDLIVSTAALSVAKLLPGNYTTESALDLLDVSPIYLGLKNGLSGQGLTILNYLHDINSREAYGRLNDIIQTILARQEADGSWLLDDEDTRNSRVKVPGLFHGIAGIALFLFSCAAKLDHHKAGEAARKALSYLAGARTLQNGHHIWTVNPNVSNANPWVECGFTGIAYVFIQAYRYFQDPLYKEIASEALLAHPTFISSYFASFSNGLAGLGEVYIEAGLVFNETEWRERANQIALFFHHTGNRSKNGFHYWHPDDYLEQKVGLCDGHAGILHFLIRQSDPDKFSFPLLQV
ncbi:protein kinase [Mucilaginibacter sp. BJC16-A38]|uniref:lanthionine synthetase LanC family protein n=1 Tax=Mucilaginibacter phenanthrenivorans TaxID=1234842 RepID=UPI002156FCEF|nr:lanthionine synthetase LanC family protein [Mucilaginibacter phenanthrenivorans]MCR8560768.1 protein kinase [Mucilaginibacter phenanthrenivorans]